MIHSRKGMGLQWYFTILAVFLAAMIYLLGTHQYIFRGYPGQAATHLQDARLRADDVHLYTFLASQSALEHALYDIGKKGGEERCGTYLGYTLWTAENREQSSCVPSAAALQSALSSLNGEYLDEFLLSYTPPTQEIIPSSNFNILLTLGKETTAKITAKNPIIIPLGRGIDIQPKLEMSFLQTIGVTNPEPSPTPTPIVPLLLPSQPPTTPQPESPAPTTPTIPPEQPSQSSTAAKVDEILKKRNSALVGTGRFFAQAEQRTKVPSAVLLAIAAQESGLKHCCEVSGKNSGKTCKGTASLSCGESSILTSAYSSIGVMQINTKVNSALADRVCTPGQTIYDMECNINVGAKLLRDSYLHYQNGIPPRLIKKYCKDPALREKYLSYRGWDAVLRAYNGLGCSKGADTIYVETINIKLAQIQPAFKST